MQAYSKGNLQKLSLVAALMTRAEPLVLDEPTAAGLDSLMEQVFRDRIREAQARGQRVFPPSHVPPPTRTPRERANPPRTASRGDCCSAAP